MDVAHHLVGSPHVRRQQAEQFLVRSPRVVQLGDGNEEPFLEYLGRVCRQPTPPDVHGVTRVAEKADQAVAAERRRHHGEIVELAGGLPRIVRYEDVTGGQALRRERREEMVHRRGQRVDVAGRPGHRLRHHASAPIEQGVGEIAGLANDRRKGDPLQCLRLLADDADQIAPDDLKFDAVHRSPLGGHDAAGRVDLGMPARQNDDRGLAFFDDGRPGDRLTLCQLAAVIDRRAPD